MPLSRSLRKLIKHENLLADNCRVDPNCLTRTERQFFEKALEKHLSLVHRPSWPDFLVCINDEWVGVEVKSSEDRISANQRRTFNLLDGQGILKIYVWDSGIPDRLIPWKRYKNPATRVRGHFEHNRLHNPRGVKGKLLPRGFKPS